MGEAYSMYGETYRSEFAMPTLQEAGKQQLYESSSNGGGVDAVDELKKLNHSLVFAYLQLLECVTTTTTDAAETAQQQTQTQQQQIAMETKVTELETLFMNMHQLVNGYRPHQAREEIVALMSVQKDRRRASAQTLSDTLRATASRLATQRDVILGRLPSLSPLTSSSSASGLSGSGAAAVVSSPEDDVEMGTQQGDGSVEALTAELNNTQQSMINSSSASSSAAATTNVPSLHDQYAALKAILDTLQTPTN